MGQSEKQSSGRTKHPPAEVRRGMRCVMELCCVVLRYGDWGTVQRLRKRLNSHRMEWMAVTTEPHTPS